MPKEKTKAYTIRELIKHLRMTQLDFAKENDVVIQTVSKWATGKSEPSIRHTRILEEKYGVKLVYHK